MTETHFDDIAGEYDESLPPHVVEHYRVKRLDYLDRLTAGNTVLDVGCGTGVLASGMADRGYAVTGVDPSQGMLDVLAGRDSRVKVVHGSATDLPFETDSFDLVFCVAVMHHVAEPAAVHKSLAEMVRVTSPVGHTVVWDHNPRNPYWKHLMARVPQDIGEERLIPVAEMTEGLKAGGASSISVEELGFVPDFTPARLLGMMTGAERLVESTPLVKRLCAHNVVVAKKG